MNPRSLIASFTLFLFVLLNPCSGQTKKVENENELSILMFNDTISYYNGILTRDTKITTIAYDTTAVKKLIQQNKKIYDDRLRVFIKISDKIRFIEPVVKIVEIATRQEVFATGFPLTKTDRSYFKVEEFSWEPPAAVEITEPKTVNVSEVEDYPGFIVVIKKDQSVWYDERSSKDDTSLTRVPEPTKENLKKIIAAYKDKADKENLKPSYYIKGDNSMKYPEFKEILSAFKENDIFKFKMVTLLEPNDLLKTTSEPSTLNLLIPKGTDKDEKQNSENEYGALTLLLGKNNVIYYYEGHLREDASNFLTSDFSKIRKVIADKKKAVIAAHVHDEGCRKIQEKAKIGNVKNGITPDPNWQTACMDKDLVILIKPDDGATHKNTVDILDEMAINDVKRYVIVDLFPVEKEIIKKLNDVNGR